MESNIQMEGLTRFNLLMTSCRTSLPCCLKCFDAGDECQFSLSSSYDQAEEQIGTKRYHAVLSNVRFTGMRDFSHPVEPMHNRAGVSASLCRKHGQFLQQIAPIWDRFPLAAG